MSDKRLDRMQRECAVSAGAAWLLAAACALLVLVLGLNDLFDTTAPMQIVDPAPQAMPPAA